MPFSKLSLYLIQFLAVLMVPLVVQAADEVERVVVLVNASDPDSNLVAKHYIKARGIPEANVIALKMPTTETITIREFVDDIYNPLLNVLIENGWMRAVKASERDIVGRERVSAATHGISYLVTTRGVPLRIDNDPELIGTGFETLPNEFKVNNGSVDGELALLASSDALSMTAFVPNPLFSQIAPTSSEAARVIRVSRLDGPSVESVCRLIDRSLQAEAEGLMGRAYFDLGGPHEMGDEWINEAGNMALKASFDTDFEKTKRPMDGRERFDAPAIYMGWYRPHAYGLWRQSRWSVPPGAIGFHLHSFSATTVRSTTKGWLGAFVNQGYCAMVGNVYEPYLQYTHRPQMLLAALLDGHTFGAAAMFSNPSLSWQGVAIGDPLYRPFKVRLDQQLKDSMETPYSAYVSLRVINRLEGAGQADDALAFARSQFIKQPSLPLAYKLATLYDVRGESKKAVEALNFVAYISTYSKDEVVLVRQIADFLNQHGRSETALDLYQKLIDVRGLEKSLRIELFESGSEIAKSEGDLSRSSAWSLQASQLRQPLQAKPNKK